MCECVIVLFAPALGFLCICTTTVQYLSMCIGHGEDLTTTLHKIRSDKILLSNQGPSKGQSHYIYSDLYYTKKQTFWYINVINSIQTSNLQKLNWYISTKHIYASDEYSIWKSPLGNYKNIYHLLIFNKLLTSSEHRNRNKPFYIYKGLIQWQGRSSILTMTNVHACKLTIDVWCGQQCHSRRHLIISISI